LPKKVKKTSPKSRFFIFLFKIFSEVKHGKTLVLEVLFLKEKNASEMKCQIESFFLKKTGLTI
jgi:hypothetical protein